VILEVVLRISLHHQSRMVLGKGASKYWQDAWTVELYFRQNGVKLKDFWTSSIVRILKN
jgi:hypothetical protein